MNMPAARKLKGGIDGFLLYKKFPLILFGE
jgi:hypothetical protein